jgi:hypothetical protein
MDIAQVESQFYFILHWNEGNDENTMTDFMRSLRLKCLWVVRDLHGMSRQTLFILIFLSTRSSTMSRFRGRKFLPAEEDQGPEKAPIVEYKFTKAFDAE